MQSPPVEWTLGIGYLAVLDYVRNHGDPDGDTLTECLRSGFRTHTRDGRRELAVAIGVGAVVLYRHLVKPEMQRP